MKKHLWGFSCVLALFAPNGAMGGDALERAGNAQLDHFDSLVFERTGCFGVCPAYHFSVHADGVVNYKGDRYVKTKGSATKTLPKEQISRLLEAINRVQFFSLHDSYEFRDDGCPEVWSDNPTVFIKVRIGATIKTVTHNYGCQANGKTYPVALTEFESKVDEIVGSAEWVGAKEDRKTQVE